MYIGQTVMKLEDRMNRHFNSNSSQYITRAIKKYGKENFEYDIIYTCNDIETLNKAEIFFIKFFNTLTPNGYNISPGGKNFRYTDEMKKNLSNIMKGKNTWMNGRHHSKETIEKMKMKRKNQKLSPEHNKVFKHNKPHSEETKKKLSELNRGKISNRKGVKLSDETKKKISESLKNRKLKYN